MDNISTHLTYSEANYSITGARHGLDNTPNDAQLANEKTWALRVFEPWRTLANSPIHVDIVFRSPAVNSLVGGVEASQHLCNGGNAAGDCDNTDHEDWTQNDVLFLLAYNHLGVEFDQLIAEDITEDGKIGWIHISHDSEKIKQRRQSMVSFFVNGKRVYRTFDILKGFIRSKYLEQGES